MLNDLPASDSTGFGRVNLNGVINCVKTAVPTHGGAAGGRIVNIASISAMRGGGSIGNTLYGATRPASWH